MGLNWQHVKERIDELQHQAYLANYADPVARDIVCELADCLKELAAELEKANEKLSDQD